MLCKILLASQARAKPANPTAVRLRRELATTNLHDLGVDDKCHSDVSVTQKAYIKTLPRKWLGRWTIGRGNSKQVVENYGERGRIRTCDPCLKRAS